MDNDLKIRVRHGAVEVIELRRDDRVATLKAAGNGQSWYHFMAGGDLLREELWSEGPEAATRRLKADLRCQSFIGVSFSAAEYEHAKAAKIAGELEHA